MKAFHSTSKGLFSVVYLKEEDLTLTLTKLKASKSARIDNIKSNVLKFLAPSFISVLTQIFNGLLE